MSKNGKISECPAIEPWEEKTFVADLRVVVFLAGFGNLIVRGKCCRNFE
jgi:hypothetical protein